MLGIFGLGGIINEMRNNSNKGSVVKPLTKGGVIMGCGDCGPKKMAKYVCKQCGKEEMKEVKEGEVVKSCCGQVMEKKE